MGDLRLVTPEDERDAEFRAELRRLSDKIDRLVDELARKDQREAQAKARGKKRAAAIRSSAPIPRTVSPEAHAAAERVIARLGRAR